MKKSTEWKKILDSLSETLNISPEILDFLSIYDILLASISGKSIGDISIEYDMSDESVIEILEDNVGKYCDGWGGFSESSVINPYYVFRGLSHELERLPTESEFSDYMQRLTGNATFSGKSFEELYKIILCFCTLRFRNLAQYRKEDHENYINRTTGKLT